VPVWMTAPVEGVPVDDRGAEPGVGECLRPANRGWHLFVPGNLCCHRPVYLLQLSLVLVVGLGISRCHLDRSGAKKVCRWPGLQVIAGGAVPQEPLSTDPWQFQTICIDAYRSHLRDWS
jgi:hypothetical protein